MAYTYIERYYGRRFEAGQRIHFTEYKGNRGKGVVRGVRGDPQYVRVLFDDGHEGDCHPLSIEHVCARCPDKPIGARPIFLDNSGKHICADCWESDRQKEPLQDEVSQ